MFEVFLLFSGEAPVDKILLANKKYDFKKPIEYMGNVYSLYNISLTSGKYTKILSMFYSFSFEYPVVFEIIFLCFASNATLNIFD